MWNKIYFLEYKKEREREKNNTYANLCEIERKLTPFNWRMEKSPYTPKEEILHILTERTVIMIDEEPRKEWKTNAIEIYPKKKHTHRWLVINDGRIS